MENETQNIQHESKIRKVIFNEISLIIAIIGMVSGVIFWVANPQQELQMKVVRLESQIESNVMITEKLQNIKDNDLHELQLKMEQIEERQIEILKALSSLETTIKNK